MSRLSASSLWLATTLAIGCGPAQQHKHQPQIFGSAAVVVTTDYRTGSWAVVSLDHQQVDPGFGTIHQDTVCRYSPITKRVYLVERMGADAVAVLNPLSGYTMETEYSVGLGTNAQDFAVTSLHRAYVARYSDNSMLVVDPATGQPGDEVDLSPWADEDGLAEPGWAIEHLGKIYVAIDRLADFQPTDYSSVLVLDASTGKIIKELKLLGTNPFSKLRYCHAFDALVLGQMGQLGVLDGGIELLHIDDLTTSDFIVSEQELGGDIIDVVILSRHKGYAIVSQSRQDLSASTSVVSFDPTTGTVLTVLAQSSEFDHSFLELAPSGRELWLAQRNRTAPGIRIFDTSSDIELTEEPIDVGLPPFMICFANMGE